MAFVYTSEATLGFFPLLDGGSIIIEAKAQILTAYSTVTEARLTRTSSGANEAIPQTTYVKPPEKARDARLPSGTHTEIHAGASNKLHAAVTRASRASSGPAMWTSTTTKSVVTRGGVSLYMVLAVN